MMKWMKRLTAYVSGPCAVEESLDDRVKIVTEVDQDKLKWLDQGKISVII